MVVDVTDDRGEVAIAGTDVAAAGADAAPEFLEIVERVTVECADERLGATGHRVLGVHRFEEQPHGAVLSASILALLLDDRTLVDGERVE